MFCSYLLNITSHEHNIIHIIYFRLKCYLEFGVSYNQLTLKKIDIQNSYYNINIYNFRINYLFNHN